MRAFIVYCHPSEDSLTRHLRDAFIRGLTDAGHEYVISDLYRMGFNADMSEEEYLRDANYRNDPTISEDVLREHAKIESSDAIVFIYPVFWTEAPSKLVGWFDRVWTYGYAYGDRTMKTLEKGLILCSAGHYMDKLEREGFLDSMKTVMLKDRLADRVRSADFVVFDGTSREKESRFENWDRYLKTAYEKGRTMFDAR